VSKLEVELSFLFPLLEFTRVTSYGARCCKYWEMLATLGRLELARSIQHPAYPKTLAHFWENSYLGAHITVEKKNTRKTQKPSLKEERGSVRG